MAIRARGARFLVDLTVRGIRKTGTARSLEEARLLQDRMRIVAEAQTEPPDQPDTWTIKQAWDKTKAMVWADKRAGVQLGRNAEYAVQFFGPTTLLPQITPDRLDAYVLYLARLGNSNATINRKLAAVSRMLSFAVERDKLVKVPRMVRKKECGGRIRFLSETEEAAFLRVLSLWGKSQHHDAVVVLVDTGMRPSELWRLEWRDCDLVQGLFSIWQTKNGSPRSVPMTERVKAVLAAMPKGADRLFPFDNFWLNRTWDKVRTHLKLSHDIQLIPYALRHTCLSRLVQRGVPLKVVQEWAGHTVISTTLRYAHLCPTNLLQAVSVLNNHAIGTLNHDRITTTPRPPETSLPHHELSQ